MWFITAIEHPVCGDMRTWGYFEEKETAVQVLHENRTDLRDCLYDYAIIEEFESGICPVCKQRQWFKWDSSREGFYEIEEPKGVEHVSNYAIG